MKPDKVQPNRDGRKRRIRYSLRALLLLTLLAAVAVVAWQHVNRKPGPVLHGRVVDSAGQPVAGADVVIWSGLATWFKVHECRTNGRGEFSMAPVMGARIFPGDDTAGAIPLRIVATHTDYGDSPPHFTRVPDVDRSECRVDITLGDTIE